MHDNGPTVPDLRRYEPGASADPHAAAARPAWPLTGERALGRGRLFGKDARSIALGISLGANIVLLVSLLSLLVLGRVGQPSPGGAGAGTALGTPTASASAQPLAGWLRVTPSSVRLGCQDGQQTQFVTLENSGPKRVQWQAVLSVSGDQAGVEVDPHEGRLAPGASVSIRIQNRTHAGDSQGGASSQQGVMRFESDTPDAGAGPSLGYTAEGC
ncbi:MAG TPA: hypothetical protein VFU88_18025 [Ktedonobacterales bacterium]|nr:hypothetical protein [Ktedonobacterales bacterium]